MLDSPPFINLKINFNYLQLLYREVKGILLYQEFPRSILENAARNVFRQNWASEPVEV